MVFPNPNNPSSLRIGRPARPLPPSSNPLAVLRKIFFATHLHVLKERICPKCQTSQLDPNGQFCENCGHKLDQPVPEAPVPSTNTPVTQVAAQPVTNAPAASNTSRKTSATSLDPASANRSGVGWRLEYRIAEEVANPPSASELILKNRISLIGRTSPRRNLHPEIACDWDDAVSHRHAQIELDTDGNANLTDLGSVNGTMLNGKAITPNIPVKLNDGDRISLGAKTALVVHAPTADVVVTNTV
jgi:hypothetical protein